MGVLGLEPKTSGLRDHCSTNWAIQIGIIGLEPIIMGSKPTALPFGYIPYFVIFLEIKYRPLNQKG